MATIEGLLGLTKEGWREIAAMDDAALAVYLKDITDLEPRPTEAGLLALQLEKLKAEQEKSSDDCPIKQVKRKKKTSVTDLQSELDDFEKELEL